MANKEQLSILKQGVKVWNQWRKNNPSVNIDLSNAHFCGLDLSGAWFANADLCRANFTNANLVQAEFHRSSLICATLNGSDLRRADLSNSNLTEANFEKAVATGANLFGANLALAVLKNADFSTATLSKASFSATDLEDTVFAGAHLYETRFSDLDMSQTHGLDKINHVGPSTVGLDTIYRSKGKIPEIFLRGCGVPDRFIAQMKALVGAEEGIQFYSCFISYSSKDEEFARRLHGRLQQAHVRVWFAPEDIKGGAKLHEQIDEAIRVHDKLLIVLSPDSLKSEWVKMELRKARKRERQTGARKLFPIRLVDHKALLEWECVDSDGGQDLAAEVREYFIPDFTNWKDHDAFESSFARLLKDLRATDLKAAGS